MVWRNPAIPRTTRPIMSHAECWTVTTHPVSLRNPWHRTPGHQLRSVYASLAGQHAVNHQQFRVIISNQRKDWIHSIVILSWTYKHSHTNPPGEGCLSLLESLQCCEPFSPPGGTVHPCYWQTKPHAVEGSWNSPAARWPSTQKGPAGRWFPQAPSGGGSPWIGFWTDGSLLWSPCSRYAPPESPLWSLSLHIYWTDSTQMPKKVGVKQINTELLCVKYIAADYHWCLFVCIA